MRVLIQRVDWARVEVGGVDVGSIGAGLLVFVGVLRGDGPSDVERLARKTAELRIFEDSQGKMNLSLLDGTRDALVVSQFTLCASTEKGRRPGFDRAAPPDVAEAMVSEFASQLRTLGVRVSEGKFGATMKVSLLNDGPATFLIESN
ncbi:MAG: D-tyrosyl-tRNA(Tyr) deacylase [Planctomycetes bacterium]|nr:D-tyrosyl-tRNA(Tyr) deacylase [Planctomycetota bacterium]